MARVNSYRAEKLLVIFTMIVGVLGFWSTYVGSKAGPQPHHHLHVSTTYLWMALLLGQLLLLSRQARSGHRLLGLAVLVAGPLLFASAATLTVHSAHRALVTGEPDALLVPNVVGTFSLGLTIWLAFLLKRRRKLHGALLGSTLILFLGPALFFALLTWVPAFQIEGPETFYRFQLAGMTGQGIILLVVAVMFMTDMRNNWAYLLAAAMFFVAEGMRALLAQRELIDPLQRLIGLPGQGWTFAVSFALLFTALAASLAPNLRKLLDGNPSARQARDDAIGEVAA